MIRFLLISVLFVSSFSHAATNPLDRLELSLKNQMGFSQTLSKKSDCKLFDESGKLEMIQSYCEVCAKVPLKEDWKIKIIPGTMVRLEGKPSENVKTISAATKVSAFRMEPGHEGPVLVDLTVTCGGSAIKDSSRLRKILSQVFESVKTGSEPTTEGAAVKPAH